MKQIVLTLFSLLIMSTVSAQNKTLVAYFSHTGENYGVGYITKGNTAIVAEEIQKLTGGDLFEIQTVRTYSDNYKTCCDEAKEELNKQARPELKQNVKDMSQYDVVYLGWPCWWGTYPMAVATFIELNDNLKGKTIIPFTTHEGSGFGSSLRDLKKACPEATIKQGLSIQGRDAKTSQQTVKDFVGKQ